MSKKSYRKRKWIDGVRYSITFDHEPSKKEMTAAFNKLKEKKTTEKASLSAIPGSMEDFAHQYIKKRELDNKLRETTIVGFESIITNTPEWFLKMDINKVTNDDMKELVDQYEHSACPTGKNKEKEMRSASTVHKLYSFYHSVLHEFRPFLMLVVDLPPKGKARQYDPSTRNIRDILTYTKDNYPQYYLALKLASIGLRREETCALTKADIDKTNVLTINKARIVNRHREQIIEPYVKTEASYRRILIPSDIADLLRQCDGLAFEGNMHTINETLHKIQKQLEIPEFTLHHMRHFAAAYLLKNKFTVPQIEDYMGWEHGTKTMEKVYAYNLDPEEVQEPIASVFLQL